MTGESGLITVFQAERAALARFLRARCGDAADVEDLLQDLWLRLNEGAAGPVANPRAYLFRMANNLALDGWRMRQRAMARDRSWIAAEGRGDAMPEATPDPAPNAEAALIDQQAIETLRAAIDTLPPGAARALRLHRIDGLPQADVARIMGISRSGVEKHLANGLRHLRERLHALVNPDCGLPEAVSSAKTGHAGPGKEPRP